MADYDLRFDSSTGTYGTAGAGGVSYGSELMFYARLTATQSDVTGDGTPVIIVFDAADVNVGTCYNTATGVFVPPTTDIYLFETHIFFTDLAVGHTAGYIQLIDATTGNAANYMYINPYAISVAGSLEMTFDQYLYPTSITAGDLIHNTVIVSGAAKAVDVLGGATLPNSWWACYKVT